MNIEEIRLKNLKALVEKSGSIAEVSRKTGTAESYLGQVINRLPSSTGKPRSLGSKVARRIEHAYNKPSGWMDKEHNQPLDTSITDLISTIEKKAREGALTPDGARHLMALLQGLSKPNSSP